MTTIILASQAEEWCGEALAAGQAIGGDSSSGAIPIHVEPDTETRLVYVSPYHYYRVPMASVQLSPAVNDDTAVAPEPGTKGECVVSEPEVLTDASFAFTVNPSGIGNWIVTLETTSIEYESKGRKYAPRSRLVQFRICTKPKYDDYVDSL